MDSDERLDATVARTGNRVVVTIEDTHQEKLGIARLEYDLVSSASPDSVETDTQDRRPCESSHSAGQLLRALKQNVDIWDALERRIHALRVKKAGLGSAFSGGEDAELRQAEEEAEERREETRRLLELAGSTLAREEVVQLEKVKDEINRLKAQRRRDGKSSTHDARPMRRPRVVSS